MFLDLLGVAGGGVGGGGNTIVVSSNPIPVSDVCIEAEVHDFVVNLDINNDSVLTIYLQPDEHTFVLQEETP